MQSRRAAPAPSGGHGPHASETRGTRAYIREATGARRRTRDAYDRARAPDSQGVLGGDAIVPLPSDLIRDGVCERVRARPRPTPFGAFGASDARPVDWAHGERAGSTSSALAVMARPRVGRATVARKRRASSGESAAAGIRAAGGQDRRRG